MGKIEAQLPKRPPEERPRARSLGLGCPATVRLTHRASAHNSSPEPGQRRGRPSEGRTEGTSRGQSQAPAGGPGPAGVVKKGRSLAARGPGHRASSSGHSGSWAMAGRGGPMGGTCGYCPPASHPGLDPRVLSLAAQHLRGPTPTAWEAVLLSGLQTGRWDRAAQNNSGCFGLQVRAFLLSSWAALRVHVTQLEAWGVGEMPRKLPVGTRGAPSLQGWSGPSGPCGFPTRVGHIPVSSPTTTCTPRPHPSPKALPTPPLPPRVQALPTPAAR